MKKLLLLSMALLLVANANADSPTIGLYADELATVRYAGVTPYVQLDLYLIATWPDGTDLASGITAAEFKMENLPANVGYPTGTVTVVATTDLIIGDLWTDWSAAWSTPQGAGVGYFNMATLEILAFDAGWIPDGHVTTAALGDDCGCMQLVDWLFEKHDAVGESFYFSSVASEPTSWGTVKSLF
jgi:hypothetical protein